MISQKIVRASHRKTGILPGIFFSERGFFRDPSGNIIWKLLLYEKNAYKILTYCLVYLLSARSTAIIVHFVNLILPRPETPLKLVNLIAASRQFEVLAPKRAGNDPHWFDRNFEGRGSRVWRSLENYRFLPKVPGRTFIPKKAGWSSSHALLKVGAIRDHENDVSGSSGIARLAVESARWFLGRRINPGKTTKGRRNC